MVIDLWESLDIETKKNQVKELISAIGGKNSSTIFFNNRLVEIQTNMKGELFCYRVAYHSAEAYNMPHCL